MRFVIFPKIIISETFFVSNNFVLEGRLFFSVLNFRKCTHVGAKRIKINSDAAFLLTVGSFLLTIEFFLLTVDTFRFFAYSLSFSAYNFRFFAYSWSFSAYSGKVRLIRALRDCKQRSLTVSKKAPTVSRKASPNKKHIKKKYVNKIVTGLSRDWGGGTLFMCFFLPHIRKDPKKHTHTQTKFWHPPSPGTIPQICLCLCLSVFLSLITAYWLRRNGIFA